MSTRKPPTAPDMAIRFFQEETQKETDTGKEGDPNLGL